MAHKRQTVWTLLMCDVKLEKIDSTYLQYAEQLTCKNMLPYYDQYGITWSKSDFYKYWEDTENYIVKSSGILVGILRLYSDENATYIRDIQLISEARSRGIGSVVIEKVLEIANIGGAEFVRLKVFKDSPAINLYSRLGFSVVTAEHHLIKMELPIPKINRN